MDSNRDGFVTKAEVDASTNSVRAKMGQRFAGRGNGRSQWLQRLDINRDGQVTRAEVDAAFAARAGGGSASERNRSGWGSRMFDRLDANRDGVITGAELDAAQAQRQQRSARAGGGSGENRRWDSGEHRGSRHMAGLSSRMFAIADANKDNRVSLQEATAAALQHFDMADANRDGQLTSNERRQMYQRHGTRSQ